jgi:hypothetical protein
MVFSRPLLPAKILAARAPDKTPRRYCRGLSVMEPEYAFGLQGADRALQAELRNEIVKHGVVAIGQCDDAQRFRIEHLIVCAQSVAIEFLGDPHIFLGLGNRGRGGVDARRGFLLIVKGRLDVESDHRFEVVETTLCRVRTTVQRAGPSLQLSTIKESPLETDAHRSNILAIEKFIVEVVITCVQNDLGQSLRAFGARGLFIAFLLRACCRNFRSLLHGSSNQRLERLGG